jgi:hypothetical protein
MSLIQLVAWPCVFISGASFGFVIGVRYQQHRLAREVAVQTDEMKGWYRRRWPLLVGAFCILMALLTYQSSRESGQARDVSLSALREVQRQNVCLTNYANRLYDSLSPRQESIEQLGDADIAFKKAVLRLFDQKISQDKRSHDLRSSVQANIRLFEHLSHERASNPYPSPPKQVCPR